MSDILVDGYNVIKNNEMFRLMELKSFEYARQLLIQQLANKYRQSSHRVIVVFDGADRHEQVLHESHIKIVYSRYGETADRVIARMAAEARNEGRDVAMYSDDEEVRHSVTEHGGNALRTSTLTQKISAPPRDIAARSAHRQHMRRIYGIDPTKKAEYDDDYTESYPTHGKHKKKRRS
jgi:predicted RNA-binding protein with PIN domain